MSAASSPWADHPAGGQARARLAAYRRYAEIVTEQEKALIAGDLEAYEALESATHEIQDRIGLAPTPDLVDDPEAGNASFVDEVADILKATLATNERIQTRLWGMRQAAGADVHRGTLEGHHALGYEGRGALIAESSFDLRF